jgi:hypothetical protein
MLWKACRLAGKSSFVLAMLCCVLFVGARVLLGKVSSPPNLQRRLAAISRGFEW